MVSPGEYIGNYRVLSHLSSDSISQVYLAEHANARGNTVAIRLWPGVQFTTPQARDAFLQEAQNLAQLQHPHILPIIDFGVENTIPYVVTPHTAQSTLRESLNSQAPQPFPEQAALNILSQVGQALFYAHQQFILHRQLSPEQISFNEKGEAVLTNFGLASILNALNTTTVRGLGTIPSNPYLAPEQLQGAVKSKLGDQYALGAIAYELFTGTPPTYAFTPPRQINPSLSPAIEEVILKALAPQPTQRYSSVDAFIQALSTAASPVAVPAAAPGWAYASPESYPAAFFAEATQSAEPAAMVDPAMPTPPVLEGANPAATTLNGANSNKLFTALPLKTPTISSRRRIISLIALALLLLIGLSLLVPYLFSILPASAATVTITPKSQHLSDTISISAVTSKPDPTQHQVGVRVLSFTSQSLSKTVNVTGHGHQDATAAKGMLNISNAGQNASVGANQTLTGASGVQIVTDAPFSITVGGTATVAAHAKNPGAGGNIPAFDINGTYEVVNSVTNQVITTVYIQNTNAFTGGQDASDYTFVRQSDIDAVANPLMTQLTPAARAGAKKQLRTNEQLVNGDVQCSPNINPDHKANDHATTVTVTVAVTCKGEAYTAQALQAAAEDALKSEAATKLGTNYILVGDGVAGTPAQVGTADNNGTATFTVKAEGIWAYQFSTAEQQRFAQLIQGKRQADGMPLLLQQQGIGKVSIQTSGLGNALPTSVQSIKFIIAPVQGLHAPTT